MGVYKQMRELWKKPTEEAEALWRERLIKWRQEPTSVRILRPTRIDRARSLGYKAKQGYLIIRQRVIRGGRQRPKIVGGRRSKHASRRKNLDFSYQHVAERRAAENYVNCEVLNSYFVGKDGMHYWYEVILVDKSHPSILADHRISWIAGQNKRVLRGLTSSARKSRGLLHTGKGAEKVRPSRTARYKHKVRRWHLAHIKP